MLHRTRIASTMVAGVCGDTVAVLVEVATAAAATPEDEGVAVVLLLVAVAAGVSASGAMSWLSISSTVDDPPPAACAPTVMLGPVVVGDTRLEVLAELLLEARER